MSVITVLAAIGIIAFTVGQQLMGATLNGRRVVILPLVLTGIGILDVTGHKAHPDSADIAIVAASAVIAIVSGVILGLMTRIASKGGYLWAQLPKQGLFVWAVFFTSRIGLMIVAHLAGAHVAASTDAILLSLGLNRVAQAAIVVPRAIAANIPFAPDKNGNSFGAGWFSNAHSAR
jgi:hypothetical protein